MRAVSPGTVFRPTVKMAYINTSDLTPQAWRPAAAAAVPLFSVGTAEVYVFPPMLTQANLKQGYIVFFLLDRAGPGAGPSQALPGIECATNGYYAPFVIGGQCFPSVEHFFQASKFHPHSPKDVGDVLAAPPGQVASIGRDPRRPVRQDWDAVRDDVMLTGLRAKFSTYPAMLACLRQYGYPACHGAGDPYWGVGPDGIGRNRLWELLQQVMVEAPAPAQPSNLGRGLLIRGKITCASTKVAYVPPNPLGPSSGMDPQMCAAYGAVGEAVSRILCGCSGRRAIGALGGHINIDGPVFLIETEDPDDPSPSGQVYGGPSPGARHETISVQTYLNYIDEGKATRSILEQLILEGMSAVRQALKKDKQLPHSIRVPRLPGALFAVARDEGEDDTIGAELDLLRMRPMLAQDGVSAEKAVAAMTKRGVHSVFLQPKLDGMRLLAFESGAPGACRLMMLTRQGTVHPIAAEFEAAVLPVLAALRQKLGLTPAAALSLDGELYAHMIPAGTMAEISLPDREWQRAASGTVVYTTGGSRGDPSPGGAGPLVPIQLNKITGAASSYGKGGVAGNRNASLVALLEYHIFTFVAAGSGVPAWARYKVLADLIEPDGFGSAHYISDPRVPPGARMLHEGPRVRLVPALPPAAPNTAWLESAAAAAVASGYEGVMIYDAEGAYEPKRSWNLVKLKATETEWFQVAGTIQERNLELANIRYLYGGHEFRASGFFSDAVKSLMYRREDLFTGRWALIRFQKVTQEARSGDGALRDPKIICIADVREGDPLDLEALAASA
jgi:ribA/ribD-fused uncharacterized protein